MSPKNNGAERKSWGEREMGVRDFAVIIGILGLLMLAGAAVVFFVTQNQPEAAISEATPITTEQPSEDSVDS